MPAWYYVNTILRRRAWTNALFVMHFFISIYLNYIYLKKVVKKPQVFFQKCRITLHLYFTRNSQNLTFIYCWKKAHHLVNKKKRKQIFFFNPWSYKRTVPIHDRSLHMIRKKRNQISMVTRIMSTISVPEGCCRNAPIKIVKVYCFIKNKKIKVHAWITLMFQFCHVS